MADLFGLGLPPTPGSIAPSGTFGAPAAGGGGILDMITKAASNPIMRAALAGYLGWAGSPRRGGRGLAMENAGMSAMDAFNQAEQEQIQRPLQQQQLLQSQLQTQALQRQLQPMPPELLATVDALKATATDDRERAQIGMLEKQAEAGLITPSELDTALQHFDEQKRMLELYKGQFYQQSGALAPYVLSQFGINLPPPAAGGPAMGASGASAPMAGMPFTPTHSSTGSIGGKPVTAYLNSKDNRWYYQDDSGTWQPIS